MGEQTKVGKNSAYVCNGASNHSDVVREDNDFYATPPVATQRLVDYLKTNYSALNGTSIWEPACGKGHISKILKDAGYNVVSTDLIDRGYGVGGVDFLNCNDDLDIKVDNAHIITNPPYKYAQEFVEKSIETISDGRLCCMFLKLTFLEGKKRYDMFQKYPPKHILVFSSRVSCALGGDFEKYSSSGGAVAYAWYIWEKGYTGKPQVEWIN